ncbi:MAG: FHA domain-containing protein [Myxococcota bacterium]|nr:FHA domain-containing protein [Myxococcota bacterium]
MLTFGDLVREPLRIAELGRSDVLISAEGSSEVVLRDKPAGPPTSTMVFMHETIAMMKAERAEQVDKLRGVVALESIVVPLQKKPESLWDHITVGRASTADIVISDPATSSVHAHFALGVDDHPVSVQDVGSSNGTFVNRKALQPHVLTPLASGDCVRFGQSVFYYVSNVVLGDMVKAGTG